MWDTLIDQTGTVERQTTGVDASGGTTRTFSAALSGVPVAVQPMDARTIEDYQRRSIQVDTMIFCTMDLTALLSGGLKSGDRFNVGGVLFIVKGVRKQLNMVLSVEPLYEIIAKQLIV